VGAKKPSPHPSLSGGADISPPHTPPCPAKAGSSTGGAEKNKSLPCEGRFGGGLKKQASPERGRLGGGREARNQSGVRRQQGTWFVAREAWSVKG